MMMIMIFSAIERICASDVGQRGVTCGYNASPARMNEVGNYNRLRLMSVRSAGTQVFRPLTTTCVCSSSRGLFVGGVLLSHQMDHLCCCTAAAADDAVYCSRLSETWSNMSPPATLCMTSLRVSLRHDRSKFLQRWFKFYFHTRAIDFTCLLQFGATS